MAAAEIESPCTLDMVLAAWPNKRPSVQVGEAQVQQCNESLRALSAAAPCPAADVANAVATVCAGFEESSGGEALGCTSTSPGWFRRSLQFAASTCHVLAAVVPGHAWASALSKYDLRLALPEDVPGIMGLVQELAEFEKEPDAVKTSVESLTADGFPSGTDPLFYVLLLQESGGGALAGMAFVYVNYSTWVGRAVYLEDLYIPPAHRRQGLGTLLIDCLAVAATVCQAPRMSWLALDWNQPAVACYEKLGAGQEPEWLNFRLHKSGIQSRVAKLTGPADA